MYLSQKKYYLSIYTFIDLDLYLNWIFKQTGGFVVVIYQRWKDEKNYIHFHLRGKGWEAWTSIATGVAAKFKSQADQVKVG